MASEDMYCGSKRKYDEDKYVGAYMMPEVREMAKEIGISLSTKKRKEGRKTIKSHPKSKAALCRQIRSYSRGHGGHSRSRSASVRASPWGGYSTAKKGVSDYGRFTYDDAPNDYNRGIITAPLGSSTPTLPNGSVNPSIWNLAPTPTNSYNNFGLGRLFS